MSHQAGCTRVLLNMDAILRVTAAARSLRGRVLAQTPSLGPPPSPDRDSSQLWTSYRAQPVLLSTTVTRGLTHSMSHQAAWQVAPSVPEIRRHPHSYSQAREFVLLSLGTDAMALESSNRHHREILALRPPKRFARTLASQAPAKIRPARTWPLAVTTQFFLRRRAAAGVYWKTPLNRE